MRVCFLNPTANHQLGYQLVRQMNIKLGAQHVRVIEPAPARGQKHSVDSYGCDRVQYESFDDRRRFVQDSGADRLVYLDYDLRAPLAEQDTEVSKLKAVADLAPSIMLLRPPRLIGAPLDKLQASFGSLHENIKFVEYPMIAHASARHPWPYFVQPFDFISYVLQKSMAKQPSVIPVDINKDIWVLSQSEAII